MRIVSVCVQLIVALCFVMPAAANAQLADQVKFRTDPQQRLDVRFRLFKTDNMWTYLLLDTRDGRIWQCTFTVDEEKGAGLKIPINLKPLVVGTTLKNGRFTLYPTDNMWNFLLLDQDDGRVWQCQFTMDAEGRFILPLNNVAKDLFDKYK